MLNVESFFLGTTWDKNVRQKSGGGGRKFSPVAMGATIWDRAAYMGSMIFYFSVVLYDLKHETVSWAECYVDSFFFQ